MMETKIINVLIVEDSRTASSLLTGILAGDPQFRVVGVATNGKEAVNAVRNLRPDVVSMDINMPEMDGLEATSQIMHEMPVPIVIVSSQFEPSNQNLSFAILKAGALTILPRPHGPGHPDFATCARNYRNTLKLISGIKVASTKRLLKSKAPDTKPDPVLVKRASIPPDPNPRVRVIAIGASAGGPMALQKILTGLPKHLEVPVLLVQHIDRNFSVGFCSWLNSFSTLPVRIASNYEELRPGYVYLPPGDFHLGVSKPGIALVDQSPPDRNLRPSVGFLFRTLALHYKGDIMAILLSGMGIDGAHELKHLHDLGALTVAQDEHSSLVFGMPGEAIRIGAARMVLPPEQIANLISDHFN